MARKPLNELADRINELATCGVFNVRAVAEKAAVDLLIVLKDQEKRISELEAQINAD